MSSVSQRLRQLLQLHFEVSDTSQATLARFLGVSPSAISRMLSGERQISAAELIGIQEFFNISFDELQKALSIDIKNLADLYIVSHKNITEEISFSNFTIPPFEESKNVLSIPISFLEGVKISRKDYLRWIKIYDDAMSPTITRGDVLIIDASDKGGVGLFLIEMAQDQYSVRRLDGGNWHDEDVIVHVSADNNKFRSFDTSLLNLKTLGRVLFRFTADV